MTGVTPAKVVGAKAPFPVAGAKWESEWTPATSGVMARLTGNMMIPFVGEPVIKIGDKVNYVSGWKLFATNAATTALSAGQSSLQTWIVTDSAIAMTVSGVAAIIALAF